VRPERSLDISDLRLVRFVPMEAMQPPHKTGLFHLHALSFFSLCRLSLDLYKLSYMYKYTLLLFFFFQKDVENATPVSMSTIACVGTVSEVGTLHPLCQANACCAVKDSPLAMSPLEPPHAMTVLLDFMHQLEVWSV
jgi:hypothetical protein